MRVDENSHESQLSSTLILVWPGLNDDVFFYAFIFKKHQSECPFKVVKCPNSGCTEKLTKQDLKIHVTFECSWRKVNCEYCQKSFIKNKKQVCEH